MYEGSVTPYANPAPETVICSCPSFSTSLMHLLHSCLFCQYFFRCIRYEKTCSTACCWNLTHMATFDEPWLLKQFLNISNPGINHLRYHSSGTFHRQMLWLPLTELYSIKVYFRAVNFKKHCAHVCTVNIQCTLGWKWRCGAISSYSQKLCYRASNSYRTLPMINDEEDSTLECKCWREVMIAAKDPVCVC